MFAYSNDGFSWRAVSEDDALLVGEIAFDHAPTEEELVAAFAGRPTRLTQMRSMATSAPLLAQLDALDAKSVRPLRAVLTALQAGLAPPVEDVAKLRAIEAEAERLRGDLNG